MIPAWVDGVLTPVEKHAVHLQGLRHKAVSVFVMRGRDVLLQRRAAGKYHTPGLWTNTCCTHPHWNEAPEHCASRRLREELAISGLTLRHRQQLEYRADVGGGMIEHEMVDVYLAEAPEALRVDPDPAEVMDFAWIDVAEVERRVATQPDAFTPWLRIYLRDHPEAIFGSLATLR